MHIIILRYHDPAAPALMDARDAHRAFLNRHFSNGDFICAGLLAGGAGEIIIARRKMREDAAKMMEKEPYMAAGAASFELLAFNPGNYAEGFERFF